MLGPYRTILRMPGTLAFSSIGWFARLPMSMVGLGIVLLVSAATGSYALAGSVSAAYIVGAAVFGPLQARLVDRLGQAKVLPAIAVLNALALGGLVLAVQAGIGAPLPQALALIAGSTSPVIGSYVRARWTHLLEGRSELHTAYALEALLDEVVFMIGPPLATLLATALDPAAGLVAALVFGLIGALLLAAQRRTEPPVYQRSRDGTTKRPLGWSALGPAVVACVGLGALFGSVEVVVVAVTTEQGQRPFSGVLLAIWATGSMLSALIIGTLRLRSTAFTRFRIGATAMALTMLPLPFISHLGLLGVVLFLAGFAISPTMIAAIGIVERTVHASRRNEGIAWVSTGLNAGVALGAAIVGPVIDGFGGSVGFFVPLGAGLLAAGVAWIGRSPHAESGSTSTSGSEPEPDAVARSAAEPAVDESTAAEPTAVESAVIESTAAVASERVQPSAVDKELAAEQAPREAAPSTAASPTGPESTIDPVSPLDPGPAGPVPRSQLPPPNRSGGPMSGHDVPRALPSAKPLERRG